MPHQSQLEKKKYRNWVQAGLGLKYVKEGLQPFCEEIAKQQHADILDKIKQQKKLSTVTCGHCSLRSLMPDHQKVGYKQCPLGQDNCNCWYPTGKITCPNKVCGAIYDQIIQLHGSKPPAPYWRNTDIHKWSTDHWSIAKCFINAPGYEQKSSAAETDCTGLLHLIRNNKEFHNHIQCIITGTDVFSKVKNYRNRLFHSSTMEVDDVDVKSIITDMKAVLQDGKELNSRPDAQTAVINLQELEKEDFIITTKCEAEVFSASFEAVKIRQRELEEKIEDSERKTKETVDNLPTKEDVGHLELRVTAMEGHMEQRLTALEFVTSKHEEQIKKHNEDISKFKAELETLKSAQSSHEERRAFVQDKLEFQSELIKLYNEKLLKVSILPQKPRRNLTEFRNLYITPPMVMEINKPDSKIGAKRTEEIPVSSIKELFMKDGRPIQSIYVVGEAGSGKSTLSKNLVNCWCLAHSEQLANKDEFDGIDEMRNYEFLFHISLSHTSGKTCIREMLCKIYGRPVLEKILDNESGTCLIILDGLDEWNPRTFEPSPFQTVGLPIQEQFKNYTVITTSRPWKLEALQITDNEIQLKVKLKEFGKTATKNFIERNVYILNDIFKGNKLADDCENRIENIPVSDIKRTPIMLQQLVCLWYDGKLTGTSRCAIYSAMLELFFKWNAGKVENASCFVKMRELSAGFRNTKLPEYLNDNKACKTNLYLIEGMSRLAYGTLFNNKKEMSVSFDSSSFERFEIPDNVEDCCLKLGILSKDKEESLAACQSSLSIYSFVHKSKQEFLAAVYIAMNAQTMLENADISNRSIQFVDEYFKCMTVEDILDKQNVLIMLSGLEPRLATYISEYVNKIVRDDKRVLEWRKSVSFYFFNKSQMQGLLSEIENCIYSCIDEVLARNKHCESRFHLGDVVIDTEENCDRFLQYCDKKSIMFESVTSFDLEIHFSNIPINAQKIYTILRYLLDCRRLAAVKIRNMDSIETYVTQSESMKCISNILEANVSTLQSVYLDFPEIDELNSIYVTLISRLPSMSRLVALYIEGPQVSHDQYCSLSSHLSNAVHLEQILIKLNCDCWNEHSLDLYKNKSLRSLELGSTCCIISVNSSNLEHFEHNGLYDTNVRQVFDILFTAYNLKYLGLTSTLPYTMYTDNEVITKKLIKLLRPLHLHHLCDLRLIRFNLTDNIITCPSEMKYLENISLIGVTMGVTTWRKFVDSLTHIPHGVTVLVSRMFITRDGEEGHRSIDEMLNGSEENAAAFQYIREQDELFTVVYCHKRYKRILFSTKSELQQVLNVQEF